MRPPESPVGDDEVLERWIRLSDLTVRGRPDPSVFKRDELRAEKLHTAVSLHRSHVAPSGKLSVTATAGDIRAIRVPGYDKQVYEVYPDPMCDNLAHALLGVLSPNDIAPRSKGARDLLLNVFTPDDSESARKEATW